MASLLAIDPGARTGWAFFQAWPQGWRLDGCGVVQPDVSLGISNPDIVVIENPQIYANGKADPDDILKLARLVGRYEERFRKASLIELVRPREWKGSIDGDIMCARIEAAMTPEEKVVAAAYKGGYRHNMIDAIGLGKWAARLRPAIRARAR